ncbi:MAG: ATP-binding protein [Candidatus Dependentiae bacterium]|nr:ATP-binding protein [Candidatus Dependentiae bacterium]
MTIKKLFKQARGLFAMLLASQSAVAMQVPAPKDPYQNIRYGSAFDQKELYTKHKQLMDTLGCSKNVFPEAQGIARSASYKIDAEEESSDIGHISIDITSNERMPLATTDKQETTKKDLEKYEADCLKGLNWERRMTLARPAIYALAEMGLAGTGAALSMKALGSESLGGSFAVFAAISDTLRLLRGTIQSAHHLISWPDNQLKELEEHFAKNKCYIPRVLWPKIINAFVSARQNEFSRETHTNFIEFALGFTTYKPKQPVHFKNHMGIDGIKQELNQRVDTFFNNYETKECTEALMQVKINIAKFIDSLLDDHAPTSVVQLPRYLYLHGAGGIGKTHFVQTLSAWIEELIPGSVRFEDLVVTGADELEGSPEKSGAFLRVLRNQLIENKRGSIVIVDEATWLNDKGMISPAKRIFNGDRSKLSTAYFGKGMDGTGVNLEMPPMLIFVASNETLNDKPLASRFDVIQYPKPTPQALVAYAGECVSKSAILKQANITPQESASAIGAWIKSLKESDLNFRYIAANIEVTLLRGGHTTLSNASSSSSSSSSSAATAAVMAALSS